MLITALPNVDFPDPDSPTIPTISPASMCREAWLTAATPENETETVSKRNKDIALVRDSILIVFF